MPNSDTETTERDPQKPWVILLEATLRYPDLEERGYQQPTITRSGRAEPKDERGYFLELFQENEITGQWGIERVWDDTITTDEVARHAAFTYIGRQMMEQSGFITQTVQIPPELAKRIATGGEEGRRLLSDIAIATVSKTPSVKTHD